MLLKRRERTMIQLTEGLKYDDILPQLREVLAVIQVKHAAVSADTLLVKYVPHHTRTDVGRLAFFDSRFVSDEDKPVFELRYAPSYTRGKDYEYVIDSKRIQNEKFSVHNSDYHTRSTVDPKKAVRIAMEVAKPFSWYELGLRTKKEANRQHEMWMSEGSGVTMSLNMGHREIYEELNNLVKQNVIFTTPAFKRAVESLDSYREWREKQQKSPLLNCVVEDAGKYYLVKDPKVDPVVYEDFDLLPEGYRSKVSLLRIMGDKHFIPEVGYKADIRTYWLYEDTV
jgi:hypothetical protein